MPVAKDLVLSNTDRPPYEVTIPYERAAQLFASVRSAQQLSAQGQAAAAARPNSDSDDEGAMGGAPAGEAAAIGFRGIAARAAVLDVVREYATRPLEEMSVIPKPLTSDLATHVRQAELDLVRAAEADDYIVELLNVALLLTFTRLADLCAAYLNERVYEISRDAPSIMEGAQRLRRFLKISPEDDWTDEEREHLRAEMELAKKMDPNAF